MTTRTRRGILIGITIVLLAGGTWAIAANIRDDERAGGEAAATTNGMAGMEGMQMESGSTVRLTASEMRQFGVTFGSVEQRMLESEVRTVGIVNFDETRIAQVTPRFGGYAEELYVNSTGQPVRRGQPLLAVYSPELVAAQEELLVARRLDRTLDESAVPGIPEGSSNLLEAATRRLRLWDISERQIQEILRTGEVRRTLTLFAPVSGIVMEKNIVEGEAFQSGDMLYTIANLSEVWVEVELREGEARSVREGTAATIDVAAYPGQPFKGRVEYVYPTLDAASRTIKARIAVANSEGRLKPGMFATVHLSTPARRALTVPATAVVRTGESAIVFVDMGGGQLMPQEIEPGFVAGDFIEVLSGVEPGQRVVTSAQFLLDSESNLAQVMKSMLGQMGSADMGSMEGMDMGDDMEGMEMPAVPPEKR
ncbi:MAG: efflux RND transporter periplasmic adaptor subunit [Gemmatimonadaceae bacterium]